MKTAIVSTNPAIKLPPLSAVLLLLSFFFSIAAWRAMDIHQDLIPHRSYQEAVPSELSADLTGSCHLPGPTAPGSAVGQRLGNDARYPDPRQRSDFEIGGLITQADNIISRPLAPSFP
ncbi:MAG: hypothetical protein ACR2II_09300 [Chthoniobacterales bacterium]